MFRIPNYFQIDMTWDEAVRTIKGRGKGNLLDGMEEMNNIWDEHCAAQVMTCMKMTVISLNTGCMR